MSHGSSSGVPGPSGQVDIQHAQKNLHSLLQPRHWSYVALWSFNHQTRSLEWTWGHFTGDSPAQRNAEVWNVHLFNLQKTCIFIPGQGSVGIAYAEQRNIWMNGPSVRLSAGSEVQAKILEYARIETAVYIPSAETVLELGTTEIVAEDMHLMNKISGFMWEHILPALGHAQASPHVSQSPLAPLLSHESHEFLNEDFEFNEQTRRTPSLNIDMFLQQPDEYDELGTTSSAPTEPTWKSSPTTSRAADMLLSPKPPFPVSAANNQVLMRFQTYRSLSGTTSSSLSSREDSSVKLSVDSPEQGISLMAPSSQRHNSHNYASSSARRETPLHRPEVQLVDTTGIPGPPPHLYDIQQAITYLLGPQEPWSQMYIDPSLEPGNPRFSAFKLWRHRHVLQRSEGSANQSLWRRSFEILRQIRNLQQSNQLLQGATVHKSGSLQTSSSSPEDKPQQDLLDQAGPSRGPRRPSRRFGAPGSGNDEAVRNHMLSERLRRRREKENFAALRRLVPIISKNDKASILADAMIYIKDLRVQIQDAQANRAELQSRYEALKSSHQELQERNKQLEAMVAATSSGGASPSLPPS